MTLQRYDVLAACKYQKEALRGIPAGSVPATLIACKNKNGTIDNFGDAWPSTKNFYLSPRYPALFTHGLFRDEHDFRIQDVDLIVPQARKLQSFYNGKPIYFSPFLENRCSREFMGMVFDKVKAVAPDLILVNSPVNGGGAFYAGVINEVHLNALPGKLPDWLKPADTIFSTDGVSAWNADIHALKLLYTGCLMFGMWIPSFNLKMNSKDGTPRKLRKHRPTDKDFRSTSFLFSDKGTHNDLPKGTIAKSHADRHAPNAEDLRAETPVLIAPFNHSEVVLYDAKGGKVVTFKNTGLYEDKKRFVYRPLSNKNWGYQYSLLALKQSGSPVCEIRYKDKVLGHWNVGFRDGEYRLD